jgi:ABC-type polysaccharide/polyol phosphate export permease
MIWKGDVLHLTKLLVLKDFKVRYRNMSLGILWSLLNPLVMVVIYTYVFTQVFRSPTPHFGLFVLCGIIPYSFFSLAWLTGTNSIVDNVALVKRIPVMREVFPIAAVLSNMIHLSLQLILLVGLVFYFNIGFTIQWLWLPVVWGFEVVFTIGLAMATSAINVYVRDTRYIVESLNLVLFWLVPIFYGFEMIPRQYRDLYQYNPVAALVLASRNVVLESKAPPLSLVLKLVLVSSLSLLAGVLIFGRLKRRFYSSL